MRRTVVGAVAVLTAASVFTLTGLGIASAATMLPSSPPGVSAAGTSPMAEAATLKTLHDQLDAAWQAKNPAAMQVAQAGLATELAKLAAQTGHAAMAPGVASQVDQAQQQNNQLGKELAQFTATHGSSAADLPPLPVPLPGPLGTLINSVLALVMSLVMGLLGGGLPALPVPVPTP